jgi:formamidopyrimidine-DNA glycosylase
MPELPEVHAHAERLHAALAGQALARFEPLTFTALKTLGPQPGELDGVVLEAVRPRGKYLILETEPLAFVVHLMQGGRLRQNAASAKRPRGGVARWAFEDGRALLLSEPGTERKAGVWVVRGQPESQEPLAGLGPDADEVDDVALEEVLRARSGRLHTVLRDQSAIAGLGRRLANEVCHRARLSPFASTRRLDAGEIERLAAALRDVLAEGLAGERAREDMSSSAERLAAVHGRTGERCPACADEIREVAYRDYTVHYCPGCQTSGRILADNTTSKFLK